ncbi:MAG: hypothetical protein HY079_09475 [Elusimicrobia bacterium]|nr:hypothetical protein [Elusimicrobiota bacterium]
MRHPLSTLAAAVLLPLAVLPASAQTPSELVAAAKAQRSEYAGQWVMYADAAARYISGLVAKKATCPFIGTAVAQGRLPVAGDANAPLAGIGDVVRLGNTGGGDLGEVLKVFAQGNHALVPDATGAFTRRAPKGFFSLDFPGSQGSHPGHSGILQGDPRTRDSGRFSQADLDRLTSRARGGWIKRSDAGKFIAENLLRDPDSKVFGGRVAALLAVDLGGFVERVGPHLLEKIRNRKNGTSASAEERSLYVALTKTAGEDNLVGSAGEFGLLFAFLRHEPGAPLIDGEPAISVADVTAMFKDKKFPAGWETWPKTGHDWVVDTTALTISAGREYLRLKHP